MRLSVYFWRNVELLSRASRFWALSIKLLYRSRSKLQYEAKIRELEQEVAAIANEKQRLANELNKAIQSTSHAAAQIARERPTRMDYEVWNRRIK